MKRKLSITIIFMLLVMLAINISSFAVDFGQASTFIETGRDSSDGIKDLTDIGNEFTTIGTVLTYIGVGILVGATGYMGILYMISPPERQAKLKQQLIGLVVSAIVIFGAYYIWQLLVTLLENVVDGPMP